MGLASDYDIYRDNAGMSAVIHTGARVLYGAGSLEIGRVSAGANLNVVRKNAPLGFTSGRARFLLGLGDSGASDKGVAFCLSQPDITSGVGTAYLAGLTRGGAIVRFRLYRCSAGLGTKTLLYESSSNLSLPTAPLAYPIEITWKLDVENLGGMEITLKRGALANYMGATLNWDTLLTVTDQIYLDNSGYLTTSVGEGPAIVTDGTGKAYFDQMSVVPLLGGGTTT